MEQKFKGTPPRLPVIFQRFDARLPGAKLKSFWQPGLFDHLLRRDESYAQKWDYVWRNPVRAKLVTKPEDWLYQGEIHMIDRVLSLWLNRIEPQARRYNI